MNFSHVPVLFKETIDALDITPDGIYVDATAGGGGHSSGILSKLNQKGTLIAVDQDPDAVLALQTRFKNKKNVTVIHSNFSHIKDILYDLNINQIDGFLFDLGVSSHQLDTASRGFSYRQDAPLDMRMSQSGMSAYDIVNGFECKELARIINVYGEERFAFRISKGICKEREKVPIKTTLQLVEIIKKSLPQFAKKKEGHPAQKTFQALRIAVNDELNILDRSLKEAFELLNSGGRLVVITFHSLEDRIVKQNMSDFARGCICPPNFPICVCGRKPRARLIHKKPIVASAEELKNNTRSKSAKLRVCEKI